jgi:hypothetical protein
MRVQTIDTLPTQRVHAPDPASASFAPIETMGGDASPGAQDKRDRRREARYPCHENADVRVLSGELGPLPAIVLDLSRSGLRLEIAAALPLRLAVAVALPKGVIVFGRIRYCRSTGQAFQAGVLIEDVFYANPVSGGDRDHLHDHQLTLYLLRKGLTPAETFSVRDHLQRCELCAARYLDALREQEEQSKRLDP